MNEATIICRTLLHSFLRTGLRLSWTRGCPHMLYDSECRVNPADFAHETEILAIESDGPITVASAGAIRLATTTAASSNGRPPTKARSTSGASNRSWPTIASWSSAPPIA